MIRLALLLTAALAAAPALAADPFQDALAAAGLDAFPGAANAAPVPVSTPAAVAVSTPPAAEIRVVRLDKARIRVDDGDTIEYEFDAADQVVGKDGRPYSGELRLMGFDTPETMHPHHGIFCDQACGLAATALTKKLIGEGSVIEVVTANGHDYYGRLLSYLIIDGQQLGVLQIKAGLAYPTFLKYPDDYKQFPAQLAELKDAWENHSPINCAIKQGLAPSFGEPDAWRKRNQHKDLCSSPEQWRALTQEQKDALVAEAQRRSASR